MLRQLEISEIPQHSRLRKTDFFESPSDVLVDEEKTLEELGIQNDDLLALELGKV